MSRKAQQSHESYVEYGEVKGPSDRSFGLTVGGILCAIGLLRWYWTGAVRVDAIVLLVVGLALTILALLAPYLLAYPNRQWMKLGMLLARIVNPVIMFVMFAIMFVPVAVVMRMFGRDALRRTRDPKAASYWITRDPPGPPQDSIVNQF